MVGPSGSGKSTLLRLCNRLEVPASGRVLYRGEDVVTLDPLVLRRRVGMVFQRPTPFPGTVLENLRVADPEMAESVGAEVLGRVGLEAPFLGREARALSGGEAQRVCLARTLATRPEAVLMDEVTSSVDPAARRGLEELARELAADGVPIVWVTHDLAQMRRLAEHVVIVISGRVAHCGAVDRLESEAPADARWFLAGEHAS